MWLSQTPLAELCNEPFIGQYLREFTASDLAHAEAQGPRMRWACLRHKLGILRQLTNSGPLSDPMLLGALIAAESQENAELRLWRIQHHLASQRETLVDRLRRADARVRTTKIGSRLRRVADLKARKLQKDVVVAFLKSGKRELLVQGATPAELEAILAVEKQILSDLRRRKGAGKGIEDPLRYDADKELSEIVFGWLTHGDGIPGFAFMGIKASTALLKEVVGATVSDDRYYKIRERFGLKLARPKRPLIRKVERKPGKRGEADNLVAYGRKLGKTGIVFSRTSYRDGEA